MTNTMDLTRLYTNIEELIDEAESWLGYLEKKSNSMLYNFTANAGRNNYTIFADWYKKQGYGDYQAQPWCAMFVSFVFGQTFINSEDIMPHFHYCPTGVQQFKKMGCFHKKNPMAGDVIFFKDKKGVPCHVGIVVNVVNGHVYTYEGNTSSDSGVVANGGCATCKSYSLNFKDIYGYGRPKYEEGVSVRMYNELIKRLEKLENKMIYNYVDDNMPSWARPTIQKLLDRDILRGNENGELGLTEEMLRIYVTNDRAGLYDDKNGNFLA